MASYQGRIQVHGDGVPSYDARPNLYIDATIGDVSRSGNTLSVSCSASIVGLSGASYFGFDLSVGFSIDNSGVQTLFSKGNSPSQWGNGAYSGSVTSSATNTSTSCTLKIWVRSANCGCTGSYGNGVWKVVWSKTVSAPSSGWKVTYDANGGSGPPSSQTKLPGQALTLNSSGPSTPKKVTLYYDARGGTVSPTNKQISLRFTGWNTRPDGSGSSYSPGGSYTTDGPITLYAQWGPGSIGSLPTPTRTDCEFIGWYTNAESGNKVSSSLTISSNTTIYAHYNYIIHYDCDGGEPETLPDQIKQHGVNLTLTSMKPWKLGMELKGWATTKGGGISYYPGGVYANNDTATMYAVYGTAEYTVRFEDGYSGAILKTEQVKAGGSATPPAPPKRDGYEFVGWMGTYKNVYADSVVYAMWSMCPVYVMNDKHEWVKLWDFVKLKAK